MLPLTAQHGYPVERTNDLGQRIEQLRRAGGDVLVAIHGDEVVGYIGMQLRHSLARDAPSMDVLAMVTDERHRRRGIGRALVRAAEEWGRDSDCVRISILSGQRPARDAAHEFYPALGYATTDQAVYRRAL